MKNIKAKKEGFVRVLGSVLILISFLITLIFDFFVFSTNLIVYIFILIKIVPFFLLIVLLKLEIDYVVERKVLLLITLIIYSVITFIISYIITSCIILCLFFPISYILILICWYYALSINQEEKLIALINGIGYCILTLIFRVPVLISQIGLILAIAPLILIIIGMLIILIAEV